MRTWESLHAGGKDFPFEAPVEWYEHHGQQVAVLEGCKGKHRDHCLCHCCAHFSYDHDHNCPLANKLYAICVEYGVVTPVWECPKFCPVPS